jgi:KDO2-lipid IV(A) lauroyltransferase
MYLRIGMIGQNLRTLGKNAAGWLVISTLKVVRRFNADRVSDIAARFMRVVGPWLPEHRTGRANLIAAFPDKKLNEIEDILCGVWENLGRVAVEFAHLDRLSHSGQAGPQTPRVEYSTESFDHFCELRDDGKPALLFAAHLGNWELPAVAAATLGLHSSVLYRRPNVAWVDRAISEIRCVNMGEMIPTSFDAAFKLAGALERGSHVGMLVDQYFIQGIDVIFFGRKTKVNPLLARLARQIECPIHGVRVIRQPGHRFKFELTKAIEPIRDDAGKIDVAGTMQAVTSIIEGWIREYPEQWLWVHRRWR